MHHSTHHPTLPPQDALALLLSYKQFAVDGVDGALRRALPLVFSKDAAIRGRLLEAMAQLYILGWAGTSFSAASAADNLVRLSMDASLGELASLAALTKELVAAGHLDEAIVHELWLRVERAAPAALQADGQDSQAYVCLFYVVGWGGGMERPEFTIEWCY